QYVQPEMSHISEIYIVFFFFQAEDGIRDFHVTGVQTCALPIYAGDQVLRVTAGGGITVYTTRAPGGSPVSLAGPPVSLAPPSLGPVQMFNLMARRSGLVSEAMGRLVRINVDGQESEALCIEALIVTTDAVVRIARSPSARPFLERLRSITVVEGQRSSVTYSGGDLRVVVDPRRGIAGRPSSA